MRSALFASFDHYNGYTLTVLRDAAVGCNGIFDAVRRLCDMGARVLSRLFRITTHGEAEQRAFACGGLHQRKRDERPVGIRDRPNGVVQGQKHEVEELFAWFRHRLPLLGLTIEWTQELLISDIKARTLSFRNLRIGDLNEGSVRRNRFEGWRV